MPRLPRVVVEGAVYHVYNRFARSEPVFSQGDEAERFIELLRSVSRRDGLTILAWCLMDNHYHLAVRIGAVPLARTMAHLQARFSMQHNRRQRSSGPLWQSRYKAKLVTDQRHLLQLIAYVHLNPVAARLVDDAADHRLSGHGELLGRAGHRLVDTDGVLLLFGTTARAARRSYLGLLRGCLKEPWRAGEPGRLPWWHRDVDRPLDGELAGPRLEPLGRSGGIERPRLEAVDFVRRACAALGVPEERLCGGGLDLEVVRQRHLVAGLAIERWRVRTGQLARLFGRRPEVVSRWVKRAGELRILDDGFREAYDALDAALGDGAGQVER